MATRVVLGRFLAVLVVTCGLFAAKAEASPTRAWQDGSIAWTAHNECIAGAVEYLTGQYMGYVGNTDVTFPRVGDIYYAHDDLERRTQNLQEGHERANGRSHVAQMIVGGSSHAIPVVDGEPAFGQWQRLLLLELDEPKERSVVLHIFGE